MRNVKWYRTSVDYKAKVLRQIDENTRINYSRVKAPMVLVSSRDIVAFATVINNPDGSVHLVCKSNISDVFVA